MEDNKVSLIKQVSKAISADKRIQIYKLSKMKEFQHPEFIWVKRLKLSPREHIPSGKKGKSPQFVKVKRYNPKLGKAYQNKIAQYLGIHPSTVSTYLRKIHEKNRERNNSHNRYKENFISKEHWDRYKNEQYKKQLFKINKNHKERKDNWENFNIIQKEKAIERASNKLLNNEKHKSINIKRKLSRKCINCNKIIGGKSTANSKKLTGYCSSCSHSIRTKNYLKKLTKEQKDKRIENQKKSQGIGKKYYNRLRNINVRD